MPESEHFEQLRSICEGIQRLHRARQAGIEHLFEVREQTAQRARDIRTRIRQEDDDDTRKFLSNELSDAVNELSNIDRAIGRKMEQLRDYENDYAFNRCSAITGSLD